MSRIELGPNLHCNLDVLVDTRLLIQANSGAGKSWLLRRLLEQTHGRLQHLVIDPEGEFSTLRERFDYVLAARAGGDTAADPRSAKLLAERLLELGVSAILDIYELKAHDRIRFVRLFLEALVNAPKHLWHPALVVVDEAHIFAPQHGDAESAGAVIDLATRGRKRGFCAVLATQRLSKLHKDAAAECNSKLIGRTGLDVDMKRAADELGFSGRDEMLKLRSLKPGEFFAFGPALTPTVQRVTVGPVETSHPKAGARIAFTPPPPTAKVRALLPKLADLPAEAEERQKSIDDLRQDVARLTRELAAARKGAPSALPVEKIVEKRVEVPVLKEGQLARLETLAERIGKIQGDLSAAAAAVSSACSAGRSPAPPPGPVTTTVRQERRPVVTPAPARPRGAAPAGGEQLSGPEQRILDALAWLESIGVTPAEEPAAAFLAGYTTGGGAWNNPKGRLRGRGLLAYVAGKRLQLTDAGRESAHAPDAPLTSQELHRMVLERLPGPERKILSVLLECYPESISNAELARRAGYEVGGGAFNNPRGRLRSLGLIEYPVAGRAIARGLLFPEGPIR